MSANLSLGGDEVERGIRHLRNPCGSDLSKVIKVTIFLKDMGNFSKIVALREKYFTPPYPADTIVEITGLALPELEIEIEAMAFVEGKIIG